MLLFVTRGLLLAVALLLAATPLAALPPSVQARSEDACPEPNNQFQQACYLGPSSDALGFISRPDDTDAYRIEVLDFLVQARVELPERPLPYRVELADWNGRIIASSMDGLIEVTLGPPGVYYVFVDSPSGQFSDAQPYRVLRRLHYPGSKIPDVLYSNELRSDVAPAAKVDEGAEYSSEGGRFTIRMTAAGTPGQAKAALSAWGPELTDFTLTLDTRMQSQGSAGYNIFFRLSEAGAYVVLTNADGTVGLGKVTGAGVALLGVATPQVIDLSGGVNRTTIRCAGEDILVTINGQEIIRVTDGSLASGRFGFGTQTLGAPPAVTFDNIIATTPSEG
jgi:hypothetical protein